MTDATEVQAPPFGPVTTLRPGVAGVPVELGDGREWALAYAGLDPALDYYRDYLFDVATAYGEYDFGEDLLRVGTVAVRLLMRAHDVPLDHAIELVRLAEPEPLIRGVENALFGSRGDALTYSVWARSSLRAGGIDPDTIPVREIRATLAALEAQGKTLPKELIPSVQMRNKRRARQEARP